MGPKELQVIERQIEQYVGLIFDFNGVLWWDNALQESSWRDWSAELRGTPLSDEEMAKKVAREFFEALIAEDYKKAGIILEGVPAEAIKKSFGRIKFLRIVEIGQPTPHRKTRSLRVPVKVGLESKGKKAIQQFSPLIRHAYKQPNRWVICGGV